MATHSWHHSKTNSNHIWGCSVAKFLPKWISFEQFSSNPCCHIGLLSPIQVAAGKCKQIISNAQHVRDYRHGGEVAGSVTSGRSGWGKTHRYWQDSQLSAADFKASKQYPPLRFIYFLCHIKTGMTVNYYVFIRETVSYLPIGKKVFQNCVFFLSEKKCEDEVSSIVQEMA